jgi:hypothetical protein
MQEKIDQLPRISTKNSSETSLSPWIDAVDLRPGQIGWMGRLVVIEADPHKCDDSRENLSFRIELADHSYSR